MEVHIGKRVAEIELVSKDGNKVELLIDGKPFAVDMIMAENGSCSILHEGRSLNAGLVRSENGKSYEINMFNKDFHVDIVDSQAKYLRIKKGAVEKQERNITAPMPGKVVKIPVNVGDKLAAGDIVIVLEAMKMQSNYKVSADCVVKNIAVKEGDAVSSGQILVELDLSAEKQ